MGILEEILAVLQDILSYLRKPKKLVILWEGKESYGMPIQITDVQSVTAIPMEKDAKGNPVPIANTTMLNWGISDNTIVSFVANSNGGVTFTALGPLGNVQVTVTDALSNLSAQDVLTVVSSAATSLDLQWTMPQ